MAAQTTTQDAPSRGPPAAPALRKPAPGPTCKCRRSVNHRQPDKGTCLYMIWVHVTLPATCLLAGRSGDRAANRRANAGEAGAAKVTSPRLPPPRRSTARHRCCHRLDDGDPRVSLRCPRLAGRLAGGRVAALPVLRGDLRGHCGFRAMLTLSRSALTVFWSTPRTAAMSRWDILASSAGRRPPAGAPRRTGAPRVIFPRPKFRAKAKVPTRFS